MYVLHTHYRATNPVACGTNPVAEKKKNDDQAEPDSDSFAAQILGWVYHFSNGATFGVMYLAMIGDGTRRHWGWAVLMALGLELGMLLTPYPQVFNIPVTTRFVMVTVAAHAVFGVGLGVAVQRLAHLAARGITGGVSPAPFSV